ncbi:hypothetical protein Glove_66g28 [Diversispora epigaea]|uniref:Uncharacterized protein n=1 Tax=Diversispora epigaea TaxID=1348612 RepID=A0A397JJQ8_9GLOM|nr:hypothetical protein Glove_66g28 [Diversispora epigaea]
MPFKLLSTPLEGEHTSETNSSLKTDTNNVNVAEGSRSTSKQTASLLQRVYAQERVKNCPPYSIVSDLLNMKANITLEQIMAMPSFQNDVQKALAPKHAKLAKITNHTKVEGNIFIMYKAQSFIDSLGRRVEKSSERRIMDIHGEKCSSLRIVTQVPVKLGSVIIAVDMEVINASRYSLVLGTDWLRRVSASRGKMVPVKLGSVIIAVDMEVINASRYSLVLGTDWLRRVSASRGKMEFCRHWNLILYTLYLMIYSLPLKKSKRSGEGYEFNEYPDPFSDKETPLSILEKKDKKKIKAYYLNTLEIEVDSRYLPTTYHTVHIPKLGLCDTCKLPLKNNNNEQIDISSLLVVAINNIENCQNDTLIQEDLDERNDIEVEQEQTVEMEMQDISNRLEIEFN